jgi:mono/diheme cytochrome c family protein
VSSVKGGAAAMVLALGCCAAIECKRDHTTTDRSLQFFDQSQPMTSIALDELTREIEPHEVEVFDPHQGDNIRFRALPLPQVLDDAYGTSWRNREAIVFTCRDGYEPTIPVQRVLRHSAFLAVSRPARADFTLLEHRNGAIKRVELGPFYLIWSNLDDARIRAEGGYGWPYQVVRIDLVSFRSRFGDMAPGPTASHKARAGFEAFIVHCSRCHSINGRGGKVGPELNYPANPTEYMKERWLHKWIDDPTSMRSQPNMPPLNPMIPDRARVIDDIIAYLEAIASHKIKPGAP